MMLCARCESVLGLANLCPECDGNRMRFLAEFGANGGQK